MNVITSDSYVSKMLAKPRIASGTGQQHTNFKKAVPACSRSLRVRSRLSHLCGRDARGILAAVQYRQFSCISSP